MRRFFVAAVVLATLTLATPAQALPFTLLDPASWLEGLSSWVVEAVSANKDGETDPPADPNNTDPDDTDPQPPPPDDARGSISGDG